MASIALDRPASTVGPTAVPRRSRPVLIWASLGVVQIALAVYAVISWASSGQMKVTPHGADALPGYARVAMWAFQVLGPILTVWMLWHFVVRPIRRDGRMSTDGMLLVAWFAIAIPNDIVMDYTRYTFGYNSYYANLGSWMSHVPGIILPNAHNIPEPLALVIPAYGWAVFLASLLGCWFMRRTKARYPLMRTASVLALTLAMFMALDFVFEMALILGKVEFYGSTYRQLTLFAGTNHQFPLYETLFWGMFWTGATALRLFTDDKGRTLAERGVDDLTIPARRRTVTRQLALIGAAAACITVFYNLPWQFAGAHANDFPKHAPSYFLNGICTNDAATVTPALPPCPAPGVPIYKD